jgi:hypothetical protein
MYYDWRRHPYTNVCRHTGLTIPECSCPVCIRGQIARARVSAHSNQGNRLSNPKDVVVIRADPAKVPAAS